MYNHTLYKEGEREEDYNGNMGETLKPLPLQHKNTTHTHIYVKIEILVIIKGGKYKINEDWYIG